MKRVKCADAKGKAVVGYSLEQLKAGDAPEGVYRKHASSGETRVVVIKAGNKSNVTCLYVSSASVQPLTAYGNGYTFELTNEQFITDIK